MPGLGSRDSMRRAEMFSQVGVAVDINAVAVIFDPDEFKTRRREPDADAGVSSVERILDQLGHEADSVVDGFISSDRQDRDPIAFDDARGSDVEDRYISDITGAKVMGYHRSGLMYIF
jgi:hypothetical protein